MTEDPRCWAKFSVYTQEAVYEGDFEIEIPESIREVALSAAAPTNAREGTMSMSVTMSEKSGGNLVSVTIGFELPIPVGEDGLPSTDPANTVRGAVATYCAYSWPGLKKYFLSTIEANQ